MTINFAITLLRCQKVNHTFDVTLYQCLLYPINFILVVIIVIIVCTTTENHVKLMVWNNFSSTALISDLLKKATLRFSCLFLQASFAQTIRRCTHLRRTRHWVTSIRYAVSLWCLVKIQSPGTLNAMWEHYIVLNCSRQVWLNIILAVMLKTWLPSYNGQCGNRTLVRQASCSWHTNCQVCRSEKKKKQKKGRTDT